MIRLIYALGLSILIAFLLACGFAYLGEPPDSEASVTSDNIVISK
jgi:hypothetical protein